MAYKTSATSRPLCLLVIQTVITNSSRPQQQTRTLCLLRLSCTPNLSLKFVPQTPVSEDQRPLLFLHSTFPIPRVPLKRIPAALQVPRRAAILTPARVMPRRNKIVCQDGRMGLSAGSREPSTLS